MINTLTTVRTLMVPQFATFRRLGAMSGSTPDETFRGTLQGYNPDGEPPR
jgi:hypothetical protein